jgi:hypothetical protein
MKKTYAVVTKPMQLITLLSVLKQDGKRLSQINLVVVEQFDNAHDFYFALKDISIFSDVFFVKSRLFLVKFSLKTSELYVDSDFAKDDVINFLSCPFGKVKVYEEGFYNYVPDLSSTLESKKSKRLLYKFFGLRFFLGGGRATSIIYLRRFVDFLPDSKQRVIEQSMIDNFKENEDIYLKLFDLSQVVQIDSDFVNLYVTSHEPDWSGLSNLIGSMDVHKVFVKLHPKLNKKEYANTDRYVFLDGNYPVELLVVSLLSLGKQVRFFHENSSAVINLASLKKNGISFVRVGSFDKSFESFFDQVLKSVA